MQNFWPTRSRSMQNFMSNNYATKTNNKRDPCHACVYCKSEHMIIDQCQPCACCQSTEYHWPSHKELHNLYFCDARCQARYAARQSFGRK